MYIYNRDKKKCFDYTFVVYAIYAYKLYISYIRFTGDLVYSFFLESIIEFGPLWSKEAFKNCIANEWTLLGVPYSRMQLNFLTGCQHQYPHYTFIEYFCSSRQGCNEARQSARLYGFAGPIRMREAQYGQPSGGEALYRHSRKTASRHVFAE